MSDERFSDQKPDRYTDEHISEGQPERLPSRSERDYEPARENALPSLTRGGGAGLSSLAQAAREKSIKQARMWLIAVGVITVLVNVFQLATYQSQLQAELKKQGMNAVPPQLEHLILLDYILNGLFLAAGVAFLVLAALVKKFPLPCTIIALVLYIGSNILGIVINPETVKAIGAGFIWKIAIIAGLISAIKAAKAYEDEKKQSELPT